MLVVSRAFVALRILHYIATRPGGMAKKDEIAKAIAATKPYTGKIAHELLLAGFIKSVRGRQGGYALALPPASIRVGEVVQFVDDTRRWRPGSSPDSVGMRAALKEAQDRFFDVLNEHSIADLAMSGNRSGSKKASSALPTGSVQRSDFRRFGAVTG